MLNLVLHYVIYGLFECNLFLSYWFYRITFLDRIAETVVLQYLKSAKINVVLAYKKKRKDKNQNGHNELNGHPKWPTLVVNDRRFFARIAAHPTLGVFESFIVGSFI